MYEFEAARELWVKALADSAETRAAQTETGDVVREDESAEGDRQFNETVEEDITLEDVKTLRSIGRKRINEFTSEDIKKAEPWARKFFRELGVKSPFFRAWFGDWREFDEQTAKIIDTKGDNRTEKINLDTGWTIKTSKKVHKETNHHSGSSEINALQYLPYIDDITENAVLLDSAISDKKNENSLMFHSFYAYTEVMGYPALLKLQVEELYYYNRNESGTQLRDYILQNIEEEPISKRNRFSRPNHSETSSSTYSISDLFSLVKQYDKNFSPKPASKVVNAAGTPKVMYHGSPNQFTVFDKKRSKSSNLYGRGFYFTDSDAHAGVYGELYKVYLNIKNPLSPGGSKITKSQIRAFLEAVAGNEDYSIENYGTYDVDEILSKITSRDAFAVIQDINATAIGDFAEAIELFNEVNGTKYDGIITDTETVVFSSTQIKSTTDNIGTFDVNNPDIRFNEALDDELTMREVLTGALVETAQTDDEMDDSVS